MTVGNPDIMAWVGREKNATETLSLFPAKALANLLDRASEPRLGDPLPPGWQWLYFLDTPTPERTGPDGHPLRGDFLPPITLERRMWASGTFTLTGSLVIGEPAERTSRIASIKRRDGDNGPLIFVVVEHRISQGGALRISEEQTLVYRAMPAAPLALDPPQPASASMWVRQSSIDPVTLFKYSALTFNGHRIHYDRTYATTVEHYPGLVVQGPLLATLLLDLLARERPREAVKTFSFRATAPSFDADRLTLHGDLESDGATLWTHNGRGVGMTAQARFGDGSPS